MKLPSFRLPAWLLALMVFVSALIPRSLALDKYVTPDEPNWVFRTLSFSAALARGDGSATVQAGHPGVTTMWLGALGVAAERAIDPARTDAAIDWLAKIDHLSPGNAEAFRRIGVLLDWARLPVIVVNALGVVGVFWLGQRLFGRAVALLAALLLALDPFGAGLGGLLHVDGVLATFSTLSLMAFLLALSAPAAGPLPGAASRRPLRWFTLSGALAGLAALSKSPALFLLPFAALIVLAAVLARRVSTRAAALGLIVFFIVCSTCFMALYPAMWTDPASALGLMFERASHHATDATRPTFFDGQAELNHGLGFYPVALAFRLSPVVMVGLALAVFYLVRPDRTGKPHRFASLALIVFSLAFVVFLTPAAKKFDRYLLPAIAPLTLVAAWGFAQPVRQLVAQPANTLANILRRGLLPVSVALQAILLLGVVPYPLMAYNPVLDGAAGARDQIAVGWGEGFGAAADWVADKDPGATIATGGLSNVAPLYDGPTAAIDAPGLATADYLVYTVSEAQLFPDFFAAQAQQNTLVHTLRIGNVDAAWVYANARSAEQAAWLQRQRRDGDAILLDAPTPLARALPSLTVLPVDATPEHIAGTFVALAASPRIVYVSTPAASLVVQHQVRAWLDANARLEGEERVGDGVIRIYAPSQTAAAALDPFTVQFDGALALIGIQPVEDMVAYPGRVAFATRWRALGAPAAAYTVTLELTDARGNGWMRFGGALLNASDFAPVYWQPGEIVDQVFFTQVPPYLAPGDYRVRLSVSRADGGRAGLVSASGAFSGTAPMLAGVHVEAARAPGNLDALQVETRVDHAWPDRARLIGVDLLTHSPATGDRFLATLYWQSLSDGLSPATELRWSLAPEDSGAPRHAWTTPLAPNASTPLRAGDLLAARYAARLPLDLPDGRYRLSLTLDEEAVDVALLDLTHRDRSFELPVGAVGIGSIGVFDVYSIEPLRAQLRAGDEFPVRVALRATDEVDVNYTFFVHVRDADGRLVAQVDTWPQGGAWPTANWLRDQIVEDTLALSLPLDVPPGDYHVVLGMYDALDGSRLPTRDAQGRLSPGDQLLLDTPIRVVAP